MSGLLASGGDAYVLYSGNHVNTGLYWNASFLNVCFITTTHVPLLPNYEEIRLVRVSVYEGGCSRGKEGLERYHRHTHTLTGIAPRDPDASSTHTIGQSGPSFIAYCYGILGVQ